MKVRQCKPVVEEREPRFEAGREALERGPGIGYGDVLGPSLALVVLVWLLYLYGRLDSYSSVRNGQRP